jgi:hypothetical protein
MRSDRRVIGAGEERCDAGEAAEIRVLFPPEPGTIDFAEGSIDDPVARGGHDSVAAAENGYKLHSVRGGIASVKIG